MGKLIATTQATVDGVIDPVGEWVQADTDHADYSFERQARSSGLVLGRKTYEGLAGYWPSQSGKWADMVNSLLHQSGYSAPCHVTEVAYPRCDKERITQMQYLMVSHVD